MRIKTIAILLGIVAAICACGCTRTVYVQNERVVHDTVGQLKVRVDTLALRDSIYEGVHGDTIVREVYRWRTRSRLRVDTVYRSRIDTVRVTTPAAPVNHEEDSKAKAAKKNLWQRIKTWLLHLIIIAALLLLLRHHRRNA